MIPVSCDRPTIAKFLYMARTDSYIAVWSDGTIMKSSDLKHWVKLPKPIPNPEDFDA